MSVSRVSRREFLETAAAAGAGLALAGAPGEARAAWQAPRVRRNLGRLDPSRPEDQKVIDDYAEGVRILRQRSQSNWNDPRGWAVQAGLHTYRCQHGNWWFLPWHRAYLYYFERMIQEAIGNPVFALPYWDWTDSSQTALPAAFRDTGSPLYDQFRRAAVNAGSARLNWGVYPNGVLNYVLGISAYVPSLSSPAANSFPGLDRVHGPDLGHGSLEGGPHDYVHVWVAGSQRRDMGDPTYAALDPIFWLHHCNIDRLWNRWLRAVPGRSHPASSTWRNQPFQFRRPDGTFESIAVSRVLDHRAAPLNYRYDDEPAAAPALAAAASAAPAVAPQEVPAMAVLTSQEAPQGPAIAVAEPRFAIGAEPLTVELPINTEVDAALDRVWQARAAAADPTAPPAVLLAIEDVAFEQGASGFVAVYLDAPGAAGKGVGPEGGRFLGTIALFAGHAHGELPEGVEAPAAPPQEGPEGPPMAMAETPPRITRIFDVSEAVLRPRAAAKGAAGPPLRVTLVRQPLDADAAGPPEALEGVVTFSRASLRANSP